MKFIYYSIITCTGQNTLQKKNFFKLFLKLKLHFQIGNTVAINVFLRQESFDNPSASDSTLPNIYFVVLPCDVYVLNWTNLQHVFEKG